MAGHFLARSGPPELLIRILNFSESPQDVLAFALTCRFMSQVWLADGAGHAAVWRIWLRDVPFAEEALTLVRANKAVVIAEQKGALPPKTMELPLPGAKHALPNASELNEVWQMQHFVDALTLNFALGGYRYPADLPHFVQPEEPSHMAEWREGVQRAIYRALIVTTALVGAYSEPLFEAHLSHDPVLREPTTKTLESFPAEFLEFVHGFPIYKLRPTSAAADQVFGFLARWLLGHILADTKSRKAMEVRFEKTFGRATECHVRGDCPLTSPDGKGSHSDAHLVVLEIMRVLWMCENITESVTINNLHEKGEKRLRKIGPIALFGSFSLWMVGYTEAQDAAKFGTEFISTLLPNMQENNYKGNISSVLEWVHGCSGEPNHFVANDAETTPLRLRFFEYCLLEHAGAAFFDGFFYEDPGAEINDNLEKFLHCATLFSLDDIESRQRIGNESHIYGLGDLEEANFLDGSEVLVSSNDKPDLYYSTEE